MSSIGVRIKARGFQQIVGNKDTINKLIEAIKNNSLPSALVFHGPSGCGKTSLGICLAEELNIKTPNFFRYDAANTKGIDTAREIVDKAKSPSIFSGYKMFLIDETHQLRKDSQECLLTTVENASKEVIFVFCTTEPKNIIKTLWNRCIPFGVVTLNEHEMIEIITRAMASYQDNSLPYEAVELIIKLAEGVPREALNLYWKVIKKEDMNEIKRILAEQTKEIKAFKNLFNLVLTGTWPDILKAYDSLELKDPEVLRRQALGYFTACMKNSSDYKKLWKFINIVDLFKEPFYSSGESGFLTALAKVIFKREE